MFLLYKSCVRKLLLLFHNTAQKPSKVFLCVCMLYKFGLVVYNNILFAGHTTYSTSQWSSRAKKFLLLWCWCSCQKCLASTLLPFFLWTFYSHPLDWIRGFGGKENVVLWWCHHACFGTRRLGKERRCCCSSITEFCAGLQLKCEKKVAKGLSLVYRKDAGWYGDDDMMVCVSKGFKSLQNFLSQYSHLQLLQAFYIHFSLSSV